MRSLVVVAATVLAASVAAFGVLQPLPNTGVTPEMFDWRPAWLGWAALVLLGAMVLVFGIRFTIQLARRLHRFRDWT